MKRITENSTMADLAKFPQLMKLQKYLVYVPGNVVPGDSQTTQMNGESLQNLAAMGWSPKGIAEGLNCLLDTIDAHRMAQYFVYEDADCVNDSYKKDVNLIRLMPKSRDSGKPFVVLCAGGGYGSVCTMVEALPTARHFLAAGYQVFMLTYRVGIKQAAIRALEDLAAAMIYIRKHKDELEVNPEYYAIGGFSAGANLISNWGCKANGYQHFGIAKPICMFPIYTFIELAEEAKRNDGGLLEPMFGENWHDLVKQYNIAELIDEDYPPCYIVCGKDDGVVPCHNSELMKERLDAVGVPAILEEGNHASHGFGDGTGTDVEGWPERAIRFLMELQQKGGVK